MAKSKVSRSKSAPKKPDEKPVSEGIKRAARRSGLKPTDPDVQSMGPAQWDAAIAHAEAEGGPTHAKLVQLAREFDSDGSGVGHGVSTSLVILGLAGRSARSCLEVQVIASRWIGQLADVVINERTDRKKFAANQAEAAS